MKRKFFCLIFLLISGTNYAQGYDTSLITNRDLYVFKMGPGLINTGSQLFQKFSPNFEIAKRFEVYEGALEISTHYSKKSGNNKSVHWSFPKLTYLFFHEPQDYNTFYYGGGISWSKINTKGNTSNPKMHFEGLFIEGTVGYELHRHRRIRTLIELSISQPMSASSHKGPHPGPSFFANIGFGLGSN